MIKFINIYLIEQIILLYNLLAGLKKYYLDLIIYNQMNRKTENEFKQMVKLGIPEETARMIAMCKHNPDSEESKALIEEEKEIQNEIQRFITEFKQIEEESKESNEEKLICLKDIFG